VEPGEENVLKVEIFNAKEINLMKEDIKSIVEIEHHPKVKEWVYEYIDPNFHKEFRDYTNFFRELPKNKRADILLAKSAERIVGFLGLWRLGVYMEHVASIGVSVHPDYWRRGIATNLIKSAIDLARGKGLRRLEVETFSENVPMRHIVEKLGFKLECLRKNRIQKGGSYHDEVVYSMLL